MNNVLLRQIVLVLAYSAQFGQPLTINEIATRLFVPQNNKSVFLDFLKLSEKEQLSLVRSCLKTLVKWGWVVGRNGMYTTSSNERDLVLADQRKKIAKEKLALAKKIGSMLAIWPWIRAVYVSGSVAAGLANIDDDIDFYIIVRPHSLWLTRPLVVGLAWLLGRNRSWLKERPSGWCFNMWSDDRSLSIPEEKRNLYSAFELAQLKLVWGELGALDIWRFNKWALQLLPLYHWSLKSNYSFLFRLISHARELLSIVFAILFIPANYLAYLLQSLYMRPHKTREVVELSRAFFHPRDTRWIIYQNWKKQFWDVTNYATKKF